MYESALGRGARNRPLLGIVLCAAAALALSVRPVGAVPVDVRVVGVEGDAEKNVRALIPLSGQDDLSDLQVQRLHRQAPDAIRKALQPFGWYRPAVVPLLEHEGDGWVATYRITLGPRVVVSDLELQLVGEGENDRELQRTVRNFPLQEGAPLLHAEYEIGKRMIQEQASRLGYLDGHFTVETVDVDPVQATAHVRLTYDTGIKYRFGEVHFQQDVLRDELLHGMIEFERGDPLDYRELIDLQRTLRQSPYFSYAEVQPDRSAVHGSEIPIQVRLEPSKPRRYEAGIGVGTDTGPQVNGAVDFRRLNRRGHRARVEGIFSMIEKGGEVHYHVPRGRLGSGLFTTSAGYHFENTDNIESRQWITGMRLTSPRGPWQETYGLEYRWEDFETGPDSGRTQLLTPFVEWMRMQTDDPIDTRRGFRLRMQARGAGDFLISDVSFFQLNPRAQGIIPVGRRNRALGRLELGWTSVGSFEDLPPSLRFYAGGATSVRGYGYKELGVVDPATGLSRGGKHLIVGSAEFEHRFLRRWGVAAFYDIGNAIDSFKDPLESGAGLGVRWISPIGPVRLDAAWALSRESNPVRIHLRIGPDL